MKKEMTKEAKEAKAQEIRGQKPCWARTFCLSWLNEDWRVHVSMVLAAEAHPKEKEEKNGKLRMWVVFPDGSTATTVQGSDTPWEIA